MFNAKPGTTLPTCCSTIYSSLLIDRQPAQLLLLRLYQAAFHTQLLCHLRDLTILKVPFWPPRSRTSFIPHCPFAKPLSTMAQFVMDLIGNLTNCMACFPGSPNLRVNNKTYKMLRLLGEVSLDNKGLGMANQSRAASPTYI